MSRLWLNASAIALRVISWKTTRCTRSWGMSAASQQVPGDGLALAVGVGRQVDFARVRGRGLQVLDHVLLVVGHAVLGRKVVLDVDRELRAQQVAHVADRRAHVVVAAQEAADRARLRRRLDDDELCAVQRARACDRRPAVAALRRPDAFAPSLLRRRLTPRGLAALRALPRTRPWLRRRLAFDAPALSSPPVVAARHGRRRADLEEPRPALGQRPSALGGVRHEDGPAVGQWAHRLALDAVCLTGWVSGAETSLARDRRGLLASGRSGSRDGSGLGTSACAGVAPMRVRACPHSGQRPRWRPGH